MTVDLYSYKLKKRKEILKLDTHLSYPFIEKIDDKIYVYPENCRSKTWKRYLYNPVEEKLEFKDTVINVGLIDATIFSQGDKKYIIASRGIDACEAVYMYRFNDEKGCCEIMQERPIIKGKDRSRMAGNFFEANGKIYRPSQICEKRYGQGITISEVDSFEPQYKEKVMFKLFPSSLKYHLGLHTLNFENKTGIAVIDGYGYCHPLTGRLFIPFYKIVKNIVHTLGT